MAARLAVARRLALAAVLCSSLQPTLARTPVSDLELSARLDGRGYLAQPYYLDRSALTLAPQVLAAGADRDTAVYDRSRASIAASATFFDHVAGAATVRAVDRCGEPDLQNDVAAQVPRAWLGLDNIAFTPLSLRAGRQSWKHGAGLIFSAQDDYWFYDAARVTYDAFPLVVNAAAARVPYGTPDTLVDWFGWAHARYEPDAGWARALEAYGGWFELESGGQPALAGLRAEWLRDPAWSASSEAAGEWGTRPGGGDLAAGLLDLLVTRRFASAWAQPSLDAGWTWASGDGDAGGRHEFIGLFNGQNWGRVFSPRLANLHAVSARATATPLSWLSARLAAWFYWQARANAGLAGDGRFDEGGYMAPPNGQDRRLGSEYNLTLTFTPLDRLTIEALAGYFVAGPAYAGQPGGRDAAGAHLLATLRF